MLIDLHTHSTNSDGEDSPSELIKKAAETGIDYLALTDHDTLSGLDEAEKAAENLHLTFIRGVELEVCWPHTGEFHLLGLKLGSDTVILEQTLQELRNNRRQRNEEILALMRKSGIRITYEELERKNPTAVIGRPHIARHLVDMGIVKHYQQAFDLYLAQGRPFYSAKKALSLESAVQAIHACQGKAVIAHPMSLCLSWRNLDMRIKEFKAVGIDGLEAYHTACTPIHCQRLKELAQKHDLGFSGGSDYHGGGTKKSGYMGYYYRGKRIIPEDVLKILE